MPGLTLWLTTESDWPAAEKRFAAAQAQMVHGPAYAALVAPGEPGCLIGSVKYPEYPLRFLDLGGTRAAVEGRIHNKTPAVVDGELATLAAQIFNEGVDAADLVRRWICGTEGEYLVVLAVPSRQDVVVFSDPMGRLPVFYRSDEKALILARECKFIRQLARSEAFDPLGWAQTLSVGYPLGGRTLLADVIRGPAGLYLRSRCSGGRVRTEARSLTTINFEEKDSAGGSLADYAATLADEFTQTCRRMATHPEISTVVLALSGGQDSRAVAAALARAGVPFQPVTYDDHTPRCARETRTAQEVARCLGMPWQGFELPTPGVADAERLVWMKDGLNYAAMAYILAFHEVIAGRWGRDASYATGDGGDKAMPDLRLAARGRSPDDLVRVLNREHAELLPEAAERICRLPPGTLTDELRRLLQSYPESDPAQKCVHYVVYERGRHWLYDGEDRARFFLGQMSPFWAYPFFSKAMRVPDRHKTGYRLYYEFQKALSPACATIPDANKGSIVGSQGFRLRKSLRNSLLALVRGLPKPQRFRSVVRRFVKVTTVPYEPAPEMLERLRLALDATDDVGQLLDREAVDRLLAGSTRDQFKRLWTLAVLADRYRSR